MIISHSKSTIHSYDSAILWETIEDVFDLDDSDEDEFSEELDECSPTIISVMIPRY